VRIVLQRVGRARVEVDGRVVGQISTGLVALIGVTHADTPDDARRLADKTAALRVFSDGERPFDRTVGAVGGAVLCVSQFTLYGNLRRGNRPSWSDAAPGEPARTVVDAYAARLRDLGLEVATGEFGAHMSVILDNDGPVTLILDSEQLAGPRSGGITDGPGA
jgi:D-aminoacyl-tRNA deacylase